MLPKATCLYLPHRDAQVCSEEYTDLYDVRDRM